MRTIRLTEDDFSTLIMMLGGYLSLPDDRKLPNEKAWKEVTDWILIQGDDSTRTYFHDKEELRARKEKELSA